MSVSGQETADDAGVPDTLSEEGYGMVRIWGLTKRGLRKGAYEMGLGFRV